MSKTTKNNWHSKRSKDITKLNADGSVAIVYPEWISRNRQTGTSGSKLMRWKQYAFIRLNVATGVIKHGKYKIGY